MTTWSAVRAQQGAKKEEVSAPVRHDPAAEVPIGEGGVTIAGWHSTESTIQCAKRGQFKSVRGIHKPMSAMPDHFAIGQLLHAGRATWFAAKFDASTPTINAIKLAMEKLIADSPLPISRNALEMALKYMDEYVTHWVTRPKPQPVACEYLVGPAPLTPGDLPPLWKTARLDDVSYYPEAPEGGLCIGEAKTTSASINDCVSQYTLHGQPILQYVLWQNAREGKVLHGPVRGVMLDIIKKGYGKDRSQFRRHFVEITPTVLAWYAKDLRAYLKEYVSMGWNDDVRRNPTACTYMAGRARVECEFRPLCLNGQSAAGLYAGRDGKGLNTWTPSPGQETPPWE